MELNSSAVNKVAFGDIENKIKDNIKRNFQNEVVNGDGYSRDKYVYSAILGVASFGLLATDALK